MNPIYDVWQILSSKLALDNICLKYSTKIKITVIKTRWQEEEYEAEAWFI